MFSSDLHWLPERPDWSIALKAIGAADAPSWAALRDLANARIDFLQTNSLDRKLQRLFGTEPPAGLDTKPIRLAILGSSTIDHLLPGLRVGALRRGLHLTTHVGDFGQSLQELNDPASSFYAFRPNATLFTFDAASLLGAPDASLDAVSAEQRLDDIVARLRQLWSLAAEGCGGQVIQQTILPLGPSLMGSNEHRLPGSQRWMVDRLNRRIREAADSDGVDILALDTRVAEDGVAAWHDPVFWHRAKQEVSPKAAPQYGDLVARLLAAQQGRSSKCLVLDLDNTLWGGVIGDDGLDGIVLGQGSSLGEAYVAFQTYVKQLARRGVILAVCSKNDEANALAPFEKHPDMVLKRSDIACFIANWQDKPANLRMVAEQLNIGIDSLVFADDNPFERTIVRRELPMVAVPELPEDPALYAHTVAGAGYFESLRITPDDLERTRQYQGNTQREILRTSSTDVASYLKSLGMTLEWRTFDRTGLQRVVQLINKTNQFNLTTRRYTQSDVAEFMEDPAAITLQLRLADMFGDNGIIAVVIARPVERGSTDLAIDTWLMSCRVLGRQVEEATLNLVAAEAARLGATSLIGTYIPTAKNGMVREHYAKLGFEPLKSDSNGTTLWRRPLETFTPYDTFIEIRAGQT
jgi:FkbH-like protein